MVMSKPNLPIRYLTTLFSLSAGNFAAQAWLMDLPDLHEALERSFFQALAIGCIAAWRETEEPKP
jgi:hypothetical protein